MAKFTQHSKERLLERYGYADPESTKIIGSRLGSKSQYRVVGNSIHGELREINYDGHNILAVIRNNRIVTFLDKNMKNGVHPNLSEQLRNRYNGLMLKLTQKNFFTALWYFVLLRKNPEYFGLEDMKR